MGDWLKLTLIFALPMRATNRDLASIEANHFVTLLACWVQRASAELVSEKM